jgi:hypothetical protein
MEWNDDNEQELVIRHHNRALRRVNKILRTSHKVAREYNDTLFKELCHADVNQEAALALRRLWEEGGFDPPCGPEDYDIIVDTSIRALKAYRDEADKPTQSQVNGRFFID